MTRRLTAVSICKLTTVALVAFLLVAPAAEANHGRRTLNVQPESQAAPVGSTAVLQARISFAATATAGTINIDFENEAGVNDIDGVSRQTPDATCSIPAGESVCTVSYTGTNPGRDRWRAWIDHDGLRSTVEADTEEGLDQSRRPGNGGIRCRGAAADGEPDCTDVVEVLWGSGTLDCDDAGPPDTERETNPAGGGAVSNENYTCRLADPMGRPVENATVSAEVTNAVNDPDPTDGPSFDSPDYTCRTTAATTTEPGGTCTITVTQNENETGTAVLCFWFGDAATGQALCSDEPVEEAQLEDESDAGNDNADSVAKTWEVRSAAAGGVDAEPETDRNPFGEQHTITATVYDQFGSPFQGNTTVYLELFQGSPTDTDQNTPGSPDRTCTTVNSATCSITYTQTTTPGTDLMCVWTNAAPALWGTNNYGTCDGEPLSDPEDTAGSADAPEPVTDDVDVVQKIWQNPTDATQLDCAPEASSRPRGGNAWVTCTAYNASGAPVQGAEIDIESSGANDICDSYICVHGGQSPDQSPEKPDFSCVTGADGRCKVIHGWAGLGSGREAGTATYRAWIDADNDNSTVEADATEQRDETTAPGGTAEPDATDVVERTWTPGPCDIRGTWGRDVLVGESLADVICGLGGSDTISGRGGNDRLMGGGGNDALFGGGGNDAILGKRGDDRLYGAAGNDRLYGGPGRDRCYGGPGDDTTGSCY